MRYIRLINSRMYQRPPLPLARWASDMDFPLLILSFVGAGCARRVEVAVSDQRMAWLMLGRDRGRHKPVGWARCIEPAKSANGPPTGRYGRCWCQIRGTMGKADA